MAVTRQALRKFYRSREWTQVGAVARALYGEKCRNNSAHGGPFHVDHIIPVSAWWGGRLLLTNLQVLCVPCHIRKHRQQRREAA